jgi:hypothetical protein
MSSRERFLASEWDEPHEWGIHIPLRRPPTLKLRRDRQWRRVFLGVYLSHRGTEGTEWFYGELRLYRKNRYNEVG